MKIRNLGENIMVTKLQLPGYESITVLRTVISERERYKDFNDSLTDDWVAHVKTIWSIMVIHVLLYFSTSQFIFKRTQYKKKKRTQPLLNLYSPAGEKNTLRHY